MWVIFNKKNWINGRNCIKLTLKLIKLTKYWHKTKWLTKFWYKVVNSDIKWCVNGHFKMPINTTHITITNHLFLCLGRPRLKSGFNPQRTQPMQPRTGQLVQLNLLKTGQPVQLNQLRSLPNMERIKVPVSSNKFPLILFYFSRDVTEFNSL